MKVCTPRPSWSMRAIDNCEFDIRIPIFMKEIEHFHLYTGDNK